MKYLFVGLLFTFSLIACKKQTESPQSLGLVDIDSLYPLKVGSVFIYRMDSTSATLGSLSTSYYLAKDSVAQTFLDNQGRTSFMVLRYLTDTLAANPYQYNESYYVTYDKNKIELLDGNNRRFINLVNPVSLSTTWSGNSYIDSVKISDNTSYAGWTYQYTSIAQPYTVINGTFANAYTVLQAADSSGVFDPSNISFKTYSVEVYAQGVGLIYKELTDYFYQTTPSPAFEDGSFGIKLNLVSYKH